MKVTSIYENFLKITLILLQRLIPPTPRMSHHPGEYYVGNEYLLDLCGFMMQETQASLIVRMQ